MREIKFRAWNTDKKIMIEPNDYDFICYSGHLGEAYPHEGDGQPMMSDVFNRIIMQFTGLEDKNGKEIYEGDILANREVHGDSFYCVVEYQRDGFKGVTVPHRNHCRSLHNMMTDEGAEYNEVIGNIYENSDLLDKLNGKENGEEV